MTDLHYGLGGGGRKMSKPTFTPGPWYVETTTSSDGECNIVFPQNGNAALSSQYVSREDAHLIAAAPDMYEALKWIKEHRGQCVIESPGGAWDEMLDAIFAKINGGKL